MFRNGGPVITGNPIVSKIMSVGQAPGIREGESQRPLLGLQVRHYLRWFEQIGVCEDEYRNAVYMAAVCRCFPGKNLRGGVRRPSSAEIIMCSQWLSAEYQILQPELIIPIGKLAIQQYLTFKKLTEVVGKIHQVDVQGNMIDIIPLPHPSGLST